MFRPNTQTQAAGVIVRRARKRRPYSAVKYTASIGRSALGAARARHHRNAAVSAMFTPALTRSATGISSECQAPSFV